MYHQGRGLVWRAPAFASPTELPQQRMHAAAGAEGQGSCDRGERATVGQTDEDERQRERACGLGVHSVPSWNPKFHAATAGAWAMISCGMIRFR